MALESAGGLGVLCVGGVVVSVVVVGEGVGGLGEVLAEEANGFIFGGRGGAEKGELRERVDVHEVVGGGGSVVHVRQSDEEKRK